MTEVIDDIETGLRAIGKVLRRWMWFIVIVTVGAVVIGEIVVISTPVDYESQVVLLITQPSVSSGAQNGLNTAQELLNLMPTFESIVVSDQVLRGVIRTQHLSHTVDDLRSSLTVTAPVSTLTLNVLVHTSSASETNAIASGIIREFGVALASVGGSEVPASLQPIDLPLQVPAAKKASTHLAKVLLIAFAIGLAFSIVAAVVLDRS